MPMSPTVRVSPATRTAMVSPSITPATYFPRRKVFSLGARCHCRTWFPSPKGCEPTRPAPLAEEQETPMRARSAAVRARHSADQGLVLRFEPSNDTPTANSPRPVEDDAGRKFLRAIRRTTDCPPRGPSASLCRGGNRLEGQFERPQAVAAGHRRRQTCCHCINEREEVRLDRAPKVMRSGVEDPRAPFLI